jgi:hypothetical protein
MPKILRRNIMKELDAAAEQIRIACLVIENKNLSLRAGVARMRLCKNDAVTHFLEAQRLYRGK